MLLETENTMEGLEVRAGSDQGGNKEWDTP